MEPFILFKPNKDQEEKHFKALTIRFIESTNTIEIYNEDHWIIIPASELEEIIGGLEVYYMLISPKLK